LTARVRPAAVAGTFYPADRHALRAAIREAFADSVAPPPGALVPAALVVPHAGFIYSGPIAASAYRRLEPAHDRIRRVVLLGPSHRVALRGLALSSADAWVTPLGSVPLDTSAATALAHLPYVTTDDRPHALEHSLEVQLPFLQTVLDDFVLVPLVVGQADAAEVAHVIEALWTGAETLVVISTDLSHYHRYAEAQALDARTAAAVVARTGDAIDDLDACGARPLRGMLRVAVDRELTVDQLDLRSSGDTAGDRDRVVGYGAFALT
jgi:AmmeMemoRadiSam system protein B